MRLPLVTFLLFLVGMLGSNANPLEVGAAAPELAVTLDSGETLSLGDAYKEGPVLFFFYPKADTPGCTKQACNLRDNRDQLAAAGIRVLGVSRDSVKAQAGFRTKYSLPYSLVADEDGALGAGFGVPRKLGLPIYQRQSFLVVEGKVAWRDLKAKPDSQSEDALAAFAALGQ